MLSRLPIVLACALLSSMAHGAPLPHIAFLSIGFREATIADFAASPQASMRQADPCSYLSVTADFNGDGKADEARVLLNEDRKVAYVVAVIQSPSNVDTYVLSEMPLEDAKNVGITLAKPLAEDSSRGFAGVTIFALDTGRGEASYFDGDEFNPRIAAAAGGSKLR